MTAPSPALMPRRARKPRTLSIDLTPVDIQPPSRWDADEHATYPSVLQWGGLEFTTFHGWHCCGCCGGADRTLPVVPEHLAGEAYSLPVNRVKTCDDCAERWRNARPAVRQIAAVILRQGYCHPLEQSPGIGVWGVVGDGLGSDNADPITAADQRVLLAERDGHRCRVCRVRGQPVEDLDALTNGELPAQPAEGQRWLSVGHLLPRWTSWRWRVPRALVYDQGNVISLCHECNLAAGSAIPPMPVAFRLLMKRWLWQREGSAGC